MVMAREAQNERHRRGGVVTRSAQDVRSRQRRALAGALAGAGAILLALAGALPAVAVTSTTLRIIDVDRSGLPRLRVVAVAPPMLSALNLPAGAFAARQRSTDLPVSSTRVLDGHLQLLIVMDRAVPADELGAEQAAAVELIRTIPTGVPITFAADGIVPAGATRTDILSTIARLSPAAGTSVANTTADALVAEPTATRRAVVLFTGCARAPDTFGDGQVRASLALDDQQLDIVRVGSSCTGHADSLAALATTVTQLAPDGDAGAPAEAIARELEGEYLLTFSLTSGSAAPVTVTVQSDEVSAAQTVSVAEASAAPAAKHGRTWWIAGGAIAAVAVLAGLGLWQHRLNTR